MNDDLNQAWADLVAENERLQRENANLKADKAVWSKLKEDNDRLRAALERLLAYIEHAYLRGESFDTILLQARQALSRLEEE